MLSDAVIQSFIDKASLAPADKLADVLAEYANVNMTCYTICHYLLGQINDFHDTEKVLEAASRINLLFKPLNALSLFMAPEDDELSSGITEQQTDEWKIWELYRETLKMRENHDFATYVYWICFELKSKPIPIDCRKSVFSQLHKLQVIIEFLFDLEWKEKYSNDKSISKKTNELLENVMVYDDNDMSKLSTRLNAAVDALRQYLGIDDTDTEVSVEDIREYILEADRNSDISSEDIMPPDEKGESTDWVPMVPFVNGHDLAYYLDKLADNYTEENEKHAITLIRQTGRPFLIKAIKTKLKSVVDAMLLIPGIDVSVRSDPIKTGTSSPETPLHHACMLGQHDVVLRLLLLEADVNDKSSRDETALWFACESNKGSAKDRLAIVNLLLDEDADPSVMSSDGMTPLHAAAAAGNDLIVRRLLKESIYINAHNASKMTPLMLAAKNGYLSIVKMLLAADADIYKKDSEGKTALSYLSDKTAGDLIKSMADDYVQKNGIIGSGLHVLEQFYGFEDLCRHAGTERKSLEGLKLYAACEASRLEEVLSTQLSEKDPVKSKITLIKQALKTDNVEQICSALMVRHYSYAFWTMRSMFDSFPSGVAHFVQEHNQYKARASVSSKRL